MRRLRPSVAYPIATRRCIGLLWLCVWASVLLVQASAWARLGGLVPEIARWWHRAFLLGGLATGYHVARFCRELPYRFRRSHARWLRWVGLPPGLAGASLLVWFGFGGQPDGVGIVLAAMTAYASGLDLAFGILPLLRGEDYRFGAKPGPEALEFVTDSEILDEDGPEGGPESRG